MSRFVYVLSCGILLIVYRPSVPAEVQAIGNACLFAVSRGINAVPVGPCPNDDPLNLASNADVLKVIKRLGLSSEAIRFKGCANLSFSASEEAPINGARRYLITYPSNLKEPIIAPITHELAHLFQFEMAGGLQAARTLFGSTKKLELGADFLTGMLFSQVLSQFSYNEFQHNMMLTGRYFEARAEEHGTPANRTASFRFGAFLKNEKLVRDISSANSHFRENLYAEVVDASF